MYNIRIKENNLDDYIKSIYYFENINMNYIINQKELGTETKTHKNDKNAIVFKLDNEKYYNINNEKLSLFCGTDNLAIFGEEDIYIGAKGIKSLFHKNFIKTHFFNI